VILFVFIALQGCGGGERYASVTGKVTLDGKPLAKVGVTFVPIDKPGSDLAGLTASGATDENGQYSLRTYVQGSFRDGALVGKHKVIITQRETWGEGDRSFSREKLPKRYNDTSELTADVVAGSNQKDFELKSR